VNTEPGRVRRRGRKTLGAAEERGEREGKMLPLPACIRLGKGGGGRVKSCHELLARRKDASLKKSRTLVFRKRKGEKKRGEDFRSFGKLEVEKGKGGGKAPIHTYAREERERRKPSALRIRRREGGLPKKEMAAKKGGQRAKIVWTGA